MSLVEFLGSDKIQRVLRVVFGLFALFLAYQIVRIILGGSWKIEQVILAFVMMNAGFAYNLSNRLTKLQSEQNYLKESVVSLKNDFKEHLMTHQ